MGSNASIPSVPNLDLKRFMGDWFVIANIPLPGESGAHNALESYSLANSSTVNVTYSYNDKSFEGPKKTLQMVGLVKSEASRWDFQPFWPLRLEYVVSHVDDDYQNCIIGRSRRDYLWIMSRSPNVDEKQMEFLKKKAESLGYNTQLLQFIPQSKPKQPSVS